MNLSKVLLRFCADNGRAMFTKEERERLRTATAEFERIQGHYRKFGVRVARERLYAARQAYSENPSEANRAALDKIRTDWRAEDLENAGQRTIIHRTLVEFATKATKELLPPILRRAANAVAWMTVKTQFEERERFAAFDVVYQPSAVVAGLRQEVIQLRVAAQRIEGWNWTCSTRPDGVHGCQWFPDLLEIKGDLWTLDTFDPATRSKSEKWRDFGQVGNLLFNPILGEEGKAYSGLEPEKAVNKHGPTLPDCRAPASRNPPPPPGIQKHLVRT